MVLLRWFVSEKRWALDEATFLGLAGVGDLLATCSSPDSRNYRVGYGLAQGEKLDAILENLGSTAEGVRTAETIHKFAIAKGIVMPITEGVYHLINQDLTAREVLAQADDPTSSRVIKKSGPPFG